MHLGDQLMLRWLGSGTGINQPKWKDGFVATCCMNFILSTPYSSVLTHDPIFETSYPRRQSQSKALKIAPPFAVLPKSLNVPAPPAQGGGTLKDPDSRAFLYSWTYLSSRVRTWQVVFFLGFFFYFFFINFLIGFFFLFFCFFFSWYGDAHLITRPLGSMILMQKTAHGSTCTVLPQCQRRHPPDINPVPDEIWSG